MVITVPRQSGKTTLLLAVECQRALGWRKPQRIAYTAQSGLDAKTKLLEDQVPLLEGSGLKPTIRRVFRSAGQEAIIFVNRSRIFVINNSETAGHGKTIDLGIIDEAFADVDNRREQAMGPAMITKPDAQLWIISTAGTEESVYLNHKVAAGRSAVAEGLTEGLAYFEWSASPDDDPSDEDVWWSCMPALGRTVGIEAIRHEYAKAAAEGKIGEFMRAYLNIPTATDERVIPASMWASVCRDDVKPENGLIFAIDADMDRQMASIVAVDSELRCELIAHEAGIGWVKDRIQELCEKWDASVALDERGPLAVLAAELRSRQVPVVTLNSTQMAHASAGLYDKIADAEIKVRSPSPLDVAVAGAIKRMSGEVWYFGRKDARVSVCPLVSLAIGVHVAEEINREHEPWAEWG